MPEISVDIESNRPVIAANLEELRYLVFQGMRGENGDSAYELAVELGFEGTEQEWLDSLHGKDGKNYGIVVDGSVDHVLELKAVEATGGGNAVTPEMFGAKGDGVTDDTLAVQEALQHPLVYLQNKYKITDSLTSVANIIKGNDAEFVVGFSEWKDYVLSINSDNSIVVSGLSIDVDNKASYGILINSAVNADTLSNVVVSGCHVSNTNNKTSAKASSGIFIDRLNTSVTVENCTVEDVYRESSNPGVIASVGIHVSKVLGVCNITGNRINGVYYDSSSETPSDADGIHVFAEASADSGTNEDTIIKVTGNVVVNVQGRFVKVQGENGYVASNTCKNYDLSMIKNFAGIDLQTGRGKVVDNVISVFGMPENLTPSYIACTGRSYTKNYVDILVSGNELFSDVRFYNGIQMQGVANKNSTLTVVNNQISGARTCVYLNGVGTFTAPFVSLISNNSWSDYEYEHTVNSNIASSEYIIVKKSNNYGASSRSENLNLSVTVPSTATTINALLDGIYDGVSNLGISIGEVMWLTHGNFFIMVNRSSATRAMVVLYYGTHIYVLNHQSDSEIYYYDYVGTNMSQQN